MSTTANFCPRYSQFPPWSEMYQSPCLAKTETKDNVVDCRVWRKKLILVAFREREKFCWSSCFYPSTYFLQIFKSNIESRSKWPLGLILNIYSQSHQIFQLSGFSRETYQLSFLQARFALRIDHQSEKGGNLKGHFGRKQFCCNFNCHYTHGAKMLTKIGKLFDFAYFSTSSKPDCGEENLATE